MDLWGVICRNETYIGLCYVNKHKYRSADLSTVLLHHCGGSRIESGSESICADPPHLLYIVHLLPIWDPGLHQSGHCVEPQHLCTHRLPCVSGKRVNSQHNLVNGLLTSICTHLPCRLLSRPYTIETVYIGGSNK